MDTHKLLSLQEANESRFNRKHIDQRIREELLPYPEFQAMIEVGMASVQDYLEGEYWDSKQARVDQVKEMNIRELVTDILIGSVYWQRPELYTSATAQMASRLRFSDKASAIATVAEIMAVIADADAYDITKKDKKSSIYIESKIGLSSNLEEFIINSEYLPPMVCKPLELINNYSSGYLTHKDSLILRSGNHHNGDICLD